MRGNFAILLYFIGAVMAFCDEHVGQHAHQYRPDIHVAARSKGNEPLEGVREPILNWHAVVHTNFWPWRLRYAGFVSATLTKASANAALGRGRRHSGFRRKRKWANYWHFRFRKRKLGGASARWRRYYFLPASAMSVSTILQSSSTSRQPATIRPTAAPPHGVASAGLEPFRAAVRSTSQATPFR